MKTRIANLSIRTKMLICFTLVSIIPAAIIFFSTYQFSLDNATRISLTYCEAAIEQTSKLIENYLQVSEQCCGFVADDSEIREALSSTNRAAFVKTEKAISLKLMNIQKSIVPQAYAIYVVGENGFQYKSVSQRFVSSAMNREMLYWRVCNSSSVFWDGPQKGSWALEAPDSVFVTVGKAVHGPDGKAIGAVIIEIPETVIAEMLQTEQIRKQSDKMGLKFTCLLDKTFKVVSHTDSSLIGTQIPGSIVYSQNSESSTRYDTDYLTVAHPIGDRWMILGGMYKPDLRKHSNALFSVIITSFLSAVGLAIALSFLLSRFISRPMKRMTSLMQQVEEGNLDVRFNTRYSDEIGIMGRVFNDMLGQLKRFMQKTRENEKRLMMLQYDVLKEQIKPHFMYNTLDTVRWLARDGKNKEVERLSLALMKFYKLHIGNSQEMVTLAEEMESVRNYLIIQKIRYEQEILSYNLELPEEIAQSMVLKLTLQPLVENAIYHGLKDAGKGGSISITAFAQADDIILCVEDTGRGITPERLAELSSMLRMDDAGPGVGLRNVNARLRLKYGSDYGLIIESRENIGTKVYVRIPNQK